VAIRVGCCGFPVARETYFRGFSAVELNEPFYNLPLPETARRWREEAPGGFVFSLKVWQLVTHPASSPTYRRLRGRLPGRPGHYGNFQDTGEVREAFARVEAVAAELRPSFLLFQTPASMHAGPGTLRNLYRFFKSARRGDSRFVWEPRGDWDGSLVDRICSDLGLIRGGDPLRPGAPAPMAYCRLHGAYAGGRPDYGHRFSDAELGGLLRKCGSGPAFVFFNNHAMWDDARRFQEMSDVRFRRPGPARRARP
jgi:uncharacterized protein YecE (DUF72 family)